MGSLFTLGSQGRTEKRNNFCVEGHVALSPVSLLVYGNMSVRRSTYNVDAKIRSLMQWFLPSISYLPSDPEEVGFFPVLFQPFDILELLFLLI